MIVLLTFLGVSWRLLRLHGSNQRTYFEAHRRTFLGVTSYIDLSFLAEKIGESQRPPAEFPWKDEYLGGAADDLKGVVTYLSGSDGMRAHKLVAGQGSANFRLFQDYAVFGEPRQPGTIRLEHHGYAARPPWTFTGYPMVPGEDFVREAPAVRKKIAEVIDEKLSDVRDPMILEDPWFRAPPTFQKDW